MEIILGVSRAVTQYVLEARIQHLTKRNDLATTLIAKVTQGLITPEQLKKNAYTYLEKSNAIKGS